ncbi:MAG: RNA polymerase sigma-70 factor [Bacteroides sp.]|nr:RNA polymerase sigma-70 factor [Bacteroides sp.]
MLKELLLVTQIKKGDIKAFEQLFRRYYAPLCWYATSIVGNRETAEEIVEELFYTIWKEKEKLNIFRSVKSYLYASAWNGCLQHRRQKLKDEELQRKMSQDTPAYTSSPEDEAEFEELQKVIDDCLARMSAQRRNIFLMHRNEGLKYAEIATRLSISVKTVEANMSKALAALRKDIETYYKE